jgi:hypothetical protein
MVKNPEYLKKFEDDWISKQRLTPDQAFDILDAMWEEAVSLGVLPRKDPMEGFEVVQRIAEFINCLEISSKS